MYLLLKCKIYFNKKIRFIMPIYKYNHLFWQDTIVLNQETASIKTDLLKQIKRIQNLITTIW